METVCMRAMTATAKATAAVTRTDRDRHPAAGTGRRPAVAGAGVPWLLASLGSTARSPRSPLEVAVTRCQIYHDVFDADNAEA